MFTTYPLTAEVQMFSAVKCLRPRVLQWKKQADIKYPLSRTGDGTSQWLRMSVAAFFSASNFATFRDHENYFTRHVPPM